MGLNKLSGWTVCKVNALVSIIFEHLRCIFVSNEALVLSFRTILLYVVWSCSVFCFLYIRAMWWSIGWSIRVLCISLLSSQLSQQRLLCLDNPCSTWICTQDRLSLLQNREMVSQNSCIRKPEYFGCLTFARKNRLGWPLNKCFPTNHPTH